MAFSSARSGFGLTCCKMATCAPSSDSMVAIALPRPVPPRSRRPPSHRTIPWAASGSSAPESTWLGRPHPPVYMLLWTATGEQCAANKMSKFSFHAIFQAYILYNTRSNVELNGVSNEAKNQLCSMVL